MTNKTTRDRQATQTARTKRAEQASPLARHFTLGSLLRFAAPSIGMMIIISLYTVTDGIFIGRFAGSDALAASNIVYPVINLVLGLAIMLASGGSALVAKNLGEGKMAAARRRFTLITVTAIALASALAILAFAAGDGLLFLLGASPELLADCRSYLYALLPFFPFAALMILFNAFFIADGRPMQGFRVSVLAGLTNAGLDYTSSSPTSVSASSAPALRRASLTCSPPSSASPTSGAAAGRSALPSRSSSGARSARPCTTAARSSSRSSPSASRLSCSTS